MRKYVLIIGIALLLLAGCSHKTNDIENKSEMVNVSDQKENQSTEINNIVDVKLKSVKYTGDCDERFLGVSDDKVYLFDENGQILNEYNGDSCPTEFFYTIYAKQYINSAKQNSYYKITDVTGNDISYKYINSNDKFYNIYLVDKSPMILATIFGTLISAVGMAIVFNAHASTGGTDIIAKILNKFFHIEIGKSLLIVDFLVTLLGAVTFEINIGLYGLLAVIINGVVIDNIIAGFKTKSEITIISEKNKEISKFILDDLERGCTFIKGIGGFTGKDTSILYTVLDRNEFIKLKNKIKEIDKNAFITVGEVHEVMGEGFIGIDED